MILRKVEGFVEITDPDQIITRGSGRTSGLAVGCVIICTRRRGIELVIDAGQRWQTKAALDADKPLFRRIEAIRIEAALRMGLGDATGKVLPKVALLAPPARSGSLSSRYLTPWTCHAAHAVTGALCVAAAARVPGSVAAQMGDDARDTDRIVIEHPAGKIEMRVEVEPTGVAGVPTISRAGVVRTARLLLAGRVFVNVPTNLAGAA